MRPIFKTEMLIFKSKAMRKFCFVTHQLDPEIRKMLVDREYCLTI